MKIYMSDGNTFIWQWQPKEHIVLEGYPDGVFVHYANCNTAEAPVVQSRRVGDKLIADIPPELMQEPHDITVYVCDADGTLHSYFIPVVERPKPESYIYEPVEILRYESLAKRIAALEEGGVGGVALDTNLTQSGKAADAKATGDEIKRVAGLIPSIEGLAKEEDIPVVPTWAMQSNKPSYTASEVGADPTGTAAVAVSAHNANNEAHSDIRLEIKAIREQLAAFMDVDDETLNELSELIAAIASNQTSIAQLTTGKVSVVDIVNNLVTNASNKPLSAAMGAALAGEIDSVRRSLAGYQPKGNYLTEHQDLGHLLPITELSAAIDTALAQAKESGEFDGPPGAPGAPGGSAKWKRIGIFTAADNINPWIINADEDGNEFSCTEFRIRAKLCWFHLAKNSTINRGIAFYGDNGSWYSIALSNLPAGFAAVVKGENASEAAATFKNPVVIDVTTHGGLLVAETIGEVTNNTFDVMTGCAFRNRGVPHGADRFKQIRISLGYPTNLVMAGSTVEIWGR